MKQIKILLVVLLTISYFSTMSQNSSSLKTELDSASYALGLNISKGIRKNFRDININAYITGFKNGIDSTDIKMNDDEIESFLTSFFTKRKIKENERKYSENKKAGEVFLEANKTKKSVKTTVSGLQYIILKNGNGVKPEASSKVKVHYHGTLINGTVFDSSIDAGKPLVTDLKSVIDGWKEGLQLMSVGSKYRFFIPHELAYGPFPSGEIKPFEMLIFEIELLEVLK